MYADKKFAELIEFVDAEILENAVQRFIAARSHRQADLGGGRSARVSREMD